MDSRAGERLRLILVLRETNVQSGPAESSTTTLIEGFFTLGMMPFPWISEVQYDCLKRQRRITQSLKVAARHCVSLTKVRFTRRVLKSSVKRSRPLLLSPKGKR